MQEKIGMGNLSHSNFTKMITGLKIKEPKLDFSKPIKIKRRKKNDII